MRQKLGQHFLTNGSVIDRMLAATPHVQNEVVVEVGPGKGVLTRALLERGDRVVAIEWDEELAAGLATHIGNHENLTVVQDDIRIFDLLSFLHSISDEQPLRYSIIANIPYYLTSYLLRQVFELRTLPTRMTLLMQREVAERICAASGSSERSVLTVMVQAYCAPEIAFFVPATSFSPPPRVESAVVTFEDISTTYFEGLDRKAFFRLVKAGFGEKRKRLANALSGGLRRDKADMDKLVASLGLDRDVRAQELTLDQWKQLYQAFEKELSF